MIASDRLLRCSRHGSSNSWSEYHSEQALFGFFASAVSVMEAARFALFGGLTRTGELPQWRFQLTKRE